MFVGAGEKNDNGMQILWVAAMQSCCADHMPFIPELINL